jgi:sugar lactone lactonase YvrE
MIELEARAVATVGAELGEGPVWVERDRTLWFTDIKAPRAYRYDPANGALNHWDAPGQVGWVLPSADGDYLAGLQSGIHRFDPAIGFTPLVAVEPEWPGNRANDATVDPAGRLWFGTMDDGEKQPNGHIYRADGRGIARLVDGISITNGPAVSPDGRTLYYNDTIGGLIYAADLDGEGTPTNTRVFARIDPADGHPDGPVVDAEGHLWVGLFGGWSVRRYAPDGTHVATVRFPVANITKVAFGGPDRRTAFATTAKLNLSAEARAGQTLAGDLFAFDPGVAGQASHEVAALALERLY